MKQYHKIQTIFKRDMANRGKIVIGKYSAPEFDYLKNNQWVFTEKVDGTNIRIMWDGENLKIGGKTDNAQIPVPLYDQLTSMFTKEQFYILYPDSPITLYGEGFGRKIQKGGGNYNPNGVSFVLFDVLVGDWWLQRDDVVDVATKLDIGVVPIVGVGTLGKACEMARDGFDSKWGKFLAEGLVLRPLVELKTRSGHRIITKIKYKDFH